MKLIDTIKTATLLGCSKRTVARWVTEGKLKAIKFGKRNKFLLADIEKFAKAGAK
jgi:excisionase family DNA binding protein